MIQIIQVKLSCEGFAVYLFRFRLLSWSLKLIYYLLVYFFERFYFSYAETKLEMLTVHFCPATMTKILLWRGRISYYFLVLVIFSNLESKIINGFQKSVVSLHWIPYFLFPFIHLKLKQEWIYNLKSMTCVPSFKNWAI